MSTIKLNLPQEQSNDSASETKQNFETYYTKSISFPSNQIDAVVGFFESRDFDKSAATSVAAILLQQAKLDGVNVFELLDTLKGLDSLQLSAVVTEVMNYSREKTSTIGYKVAEPTNLLEARNIIY
jgi:hypothetical protein